MSGKFFFSAKEDEKLVECVAAFPGLYDSEDRDYKDRYSRENSWAQISGSVERSTEECKKRWRNIKDTYFKLKRNRSKSGLPMRSKSKWPLLEQLTFLGNIKTKPRPQVSEDRSNFEDESNDGNLSSIEDANDYSDPLRTTKKRTSSFSSSTATKKQKDDIITTFEVLEPESEISDSDNIQNINWRSDDEDPVLLFFKSMAMTVKTFEPQMIPEVKSRIFNVVNEFEIKCIRKKYGLANHTSLEGDAIETSLNIEDKYSHTSSFHHTDLG